MCKKLNNLTFVKAGSREDLCESATNKNRLHIGCRMDCWIELGGRTRGGQTVRWRGGQEVGKGRVKREHKTCMLTLLNSGIILGNRRV